MRHWDHAFAKSPEIAQITFANQVDMGIEWIFN